VKEINWYKEFRLFMKKLLKITDKQELLKETVNGIINHFPFERAALFSYNRNTRIKQGEIGVGLPSNEVILIKEEIIECPSFFKAMMEKGAIWSRDVTVENQLPAKYIQQFSLQSVVVQPLLALNSVCGFLILDSRYSSFKPDPELFGLFQFLGQELGSYFLQQNVFTALSEAEKTSPFFLSPREKQVLQGLADGYSIQEIADALQISHLTARDYCSSIIKKLRATDRAHALAIAFRNGLIL
jgi:DNA-binding CsgD family transcriptional regulator